MGSLHTSSTSDPTDVLRRLSNLLSFQDPKQNDMAATERHRQRQVAILPLSKRRLIPGPPSLPSRLAGRDFGMLSLEDVQ